MKNQVQGYPAISETKIPAAKRSVQPLGLSISLISVPGDGTLRWIERLDYRFSTVVFLLILVLRCTVAEANPVVLKCMFSSNRGPKIVEIIFDEAAGKIIDGGDVLEQELVNGTPYGSYCHWDVKFTPIAISWRLVGTCNGAVKGGGLGAVINRETGHIVHHLWGQGACIVKKVHAKF